MELVASKHEDGSLSAEIMRACEPDMLLSAAGAKLLEQSISRDQRRKDGVFFSGLELADYVANRVKALIEDGATIADPTCGGGDLLLACLRLFPRKEHALATSSSWGARVKGYDLQPAFAEAARIRMAALALGACKDADESLSRLSLEFGGVVPGDYMANAESLSEIDVIVANPPFGNMLAPLGCQWSTGQTQRAAVFVDQMVQHAKIGQNIVAVLPDVLRSGSRYRRWRSRIEQRCQILDIHRYGKFGESADIDVFVVHMCKKIAQDINSASGDWIGVEEFSNQGKLSDNFDVSIGSVVPHRHGNTGKWCYYLDVASAAPNSEVSMLKKRRFNGRLAVPPFVVIRRTSSPSDNQRVVPTLVLLDDPVAVENHLIILTPHDGEVSACRKLMEQLKMEQVDKWVNKANRCRHLTKGLVENIPIEGGEA